MPSLRRRAASPSLRRPPIHLDLDRARGLDWTIAISVAGDMCPGYSDRELAAALHRVAAALIEANVGDAYAYVTPGSRSVQIELCDGETFDALAAKAQDALESLGFVACSHF